jgi:hypothetical protein
MRTRLAGLATLLILVLAAACAPPGAPKSQSTQPSSGRSPSPGSIAAFIPVAQRFVEQHRGLKFKRPVKVTYLDDQAFTQRVQSGNQSDPTVTRRDSKELRALHLIQPGTDLQHVEDELLVNGVLGFYDPRTKELVVRGRDTSPETQHVLVHELTHALQDQWFGIDQLGRPDPTSESEAYRALVEGDARRIENQYLQSLTPEQRRQAQGGSASLPPDVPAVLVEMLAFPYVVGPPFTASLLSDGGQARLDAAFTSARPKYTAEVLHPDRYLSGFQASRVSKPTPDGTQFDTGIFGEEDLLFVLERLPNRPSTTAIRDIAAGWRGDSYVAYDGGGAVPCLRVAMRMDTQAHAQQLSAALGPAPGFAVDSQTGDQVGWTACASG